MEEREEEKRREETRGEVTLNEWVQHRGARQDGIEPGSRTIIKIIIRAKYFMIIVLVSVKLGNQKLHIYRYIYQYIHKNGLFRILSTTFINYLTII